MNVKIQFFSSDWYDKLYYAFIFNYWTLNIFKGKREIKQQVQLIHGNGSLHQ